MKKIKNYDLVMYLLISLYFVFYGILISTEIDVVFGIVFGLIMGICLFFAYGIPLLIALILNIINIRKNKKIIEIIEILLLIFFIISYYINWYKDNDGFNSILYYTPILLSCILIIKKLTLKNLIK